MDDDQTRLALEGLETLRTMGLALNRAVKAATEGLAEVGLLAVRHGDQEVAELAIKTAERVLALAGEAI